MLLLLLLLIVVIVVIIVIDIVIVIVIDIVIVCLLLILIIVIVCYCYCCKCNCCSVASCGFLSRSVCLFWLVQSLLGAKHTSYYVAAAATRTTHTAHSLSRTVFCSFYSFRGPSAHSVLWSICPESLFPVVGS